MTPVPAITAQTFVDNVLHSELLNQADLDRAFATMPETDDPMAIARHLLKLNLLTRFQATRLMKGKTDGFFLGQYRIMEEIGRGGMGRVYKAIHQTMGRNVAVKVLAPELTKTERAKQLFQREVRAAAKLNHPNIVTAYDANHAGDRFFLVMEYVDGPNLSSLVKDHGPLSIQQACEFIKQTAIGLAYAHGLGLIHRDIKPANLLVHTPSTGPQIKILDFGLACMTNTEDPRMIDDSAPPQTMLGTADYVSPEQARNHKTVDTRADLYSLGCTFYYLLVGHGPFPGGTALEKIVRHTADAPPAIQALRPDVPDGIASIVHRLLAKNPDWRYQKAMDLVTDLEAAMTGGTLDWNPPSKPTLQANDSSALSTPEEDPFSQLLDENTDTTHPGAQQVTDENTAPPPRSRPAPRPRPVPQRSHGSMWVILLGVAALGVLIACGLAVRFVAHQWGG